MRYNSLSIQEIVHGTPDVNNRILRGAAIPTAGAYIVGDLVINSVPAAAGVWAWVCTTAGSPGTWKIVGGTIEA